MSIDILKNNMQVWFLSPQLLHPAQSHWHLEPDKKKRGFCLFDIRQMLELFWNVQSSTERRKEWQNTLHSIFVFRDKNHWEERNRNENRKKKNPHQNLRFLNLKENLKNNELKRRLRRFEHMALSSVLFEKLPQVLFHLCKLDCPLLWNDMTPGGRCFHLCAGQQLYRVPKSGEAVKRVRTLKGTN